jgi:diguanylate cyclase
LSLAALCAWLVSSSALATPRAIRVASELPGIAIGKHLAYLEDRGGQVSLDDVLEGRVRILTPHEHDVPNFGFSRSVYWFETRIENTSGEAQRLLLEIAYPMLDEVDFYAVDAAGRVLFHSATGNLRLFDARPIAHRHFLFPLALGPRESQRVLLRVRSNVAVQVPARVWSEHAFIESDQWDALLQGTYVGFMLVMILYNLFLYVSVRERMYLLYVLMVAGQLAFQYALHGLAFATLWPGSFAFNRVLPPLIIPIVTWAANAFAVEFLDLSRRDPRWYRITRVVRVLCLVAAALAPFLPFDVGIALGCTLAGIAAFTVLVAFFLLYPSAKRQVLILGVGWGPLLAGTFALVADKFAFIPRSFWTENLVQIGSAIEVVVLSIALGDRINQERDQKLEAQARALEHERSAQRAHQEALLMQRRANETLERRVQERTRELAEANARLSEMSTRDALTGLRNRRYFNERFHDEFARALREGTSLSVLMVDVDHFKTINDRHGHLVGDRCLVAVADVLRTSVSRTTDTVARYGGEEFALVLPNTETEGATKIGEQVRRGVETLSIEAEGELLSLSVSIGVLSRVPSRGEQRELFLSRADGALYQAKMRGRNRVHVLELN